MWLFDKVNEEGSIWSKFNNVNTIDIILAILLAFVPILQHYVGVISAGASVLIIFFPYIVMKIVLNIKGVEKKNLLIIAPILVYSIYEVINHGTNFYEFAAFCLMNTFFVAIACNCINFKIFIKSVIAICAVASVVIIIQTFLYDMFQLHMQVIPVSFLSDGATEQWILLSRTGLIGVTNEIMGVYRPSAFFLEPSHMFIYFFPAVMYLLLSPNLTKVRFSLAVLLSIGLVCSTSGMGIAFVAGTWILYLALFRGGDNRPSFKKLFRLTNIIAIGTVLVGFFGMYIFSENFRESIIRIFESAISGRVDQANILIFGLEGRELIFGVADTSEGITFNLSGFAATLYKHGIVGVVLSYVYYVFALFRRLPEYFWIAVVVLVLSLFSAHTHGSFYMFYYVFILFYGYTLKKNEDKNKDKSKAFDWRNLWIKIKN